MEQTQLDMEKRMGDFWSSVQCASAYIYQSAAFGGSWALGPLTMFPFLLLSHLYLYLRSHVGERDWQCNDCILESSL